MNDIQIQKAKLLGRCVFLPGSYPKRFAQDMASLANVKPETELSEKQANYLDILFHMYRKQIPNHQRICKCKAMQTQITAQRVTK